jgi:hypothetical protein
LFLKHLVISELIHISYVCVCKVSALVTGEFYTKKEHFPGFARPFVFNAELMLRLVVTTFDYISNEKSELTVIDF